MNYTFLDMHLMRLTSLIVFKYIKRYILHSRKGNKRDTKINLEVNLWMMRVADKKKFCYVKNIRFLLVVEKA